MSLWAEEGAKMNGLPMDMGVCAPVQRPSVFSLSAIGGKTGPREKFSL